MLRRRLAAEGSACECGGAALLLACAMVLSIPIADPVHAQMASIEDPGSHPILRPTAAVGAVVWTHGRSLDAEDSLSTTPSYIEDFRQQRWDAFRLNRMRAEDSMGAASQLSLLSRRG